MSQPQLRALVPNGYVDGEPYWDIGVDFVERRVREYGDDYLEGVKVAYEHPEWFGRRYVRSEPAEVDEIAPNGLFSRHDGK